MYNLIQLVAQEVFFLKNQCNKYIKGLDIRQCLYKFFPKDQDLQVFFTFFFIISQMKKANKGKSSTHTKK